jgi:radical SAM protein with 4Fe4S-binding SPASM domain
MINKKQSNSKMVCALIQATHLSDIFPGKSMVTVAGKTVLRNIVERIRKTESISEIILATSNLPIDDKLAREAKSLEVKVFRGSELDVIQRLALAVKIFPGETIVKINGNYPLFDPFLADILIKEHIKEGFEFSYNEHLSGTIYGTGCEVLKKQLLIDLDKKVLTLEQREAGTLYFYQNQSLYKVKRMAYCDPRPYYKVCFDTEKDLRLIEFIFNNLEKPYTKEIIALLDNNLILAESNRYETVKEVGIEKLHLFPQKVATLYKNNFSKLDITYPISVELSLTNRCNYNCLWCSDRALRKRLNGDIDFDVVKRLFEDLKNGGTKGIVIEGGGEPTLHEHFNDVVDLAYDLGFGVGLITNGSRSLNKRILKKLEWIRVSLDASNPEEHRTLKGKDGFEDVMSNVKSFCPSSAVVGIGYVVTKRNIGSLESLILRLRGFGVDYIQFRPVIDHPELEDDTDLSYLKRYENSKFSIIIDGMKENIVEGNNGLPCIAHSLTSVITSDGGVYLCGRLNIYKWLEAIGNVNKDSFNTIWRSDKRKVQSKMVLNQNFCKEFCPRCRLSKFNQLFKRISSIKTNNFI